MQCVGSFCSGKKAYLLAPNFNTQNIERLSKGMFHSSKKCTKFQLKQKDSYKIPMKTIEIQAEGVRDSKE